MKDDLTLRLGLVIRKLRLELRLTQQGLASKAALHRTYISDVERGGRNVSIEILQRIARALDKPLSDIFALAEKPTESADLK